MTKSDIDFARIIITSGLIYPLYLSTGHIFRSLSKLANIDVGFCATHARNIEMRKFLFLSF